MLAQWDGRRRYANLRKLARLARSYEELRGPDIEGFVRFVAEQEAVGAAELEAVAEEEGADAVRLLTIHAAKGLEFKVVVVADAGRDRERAVARTRSSASPTAASASGSPTRSRASGTACSTTRTSRTRASAEDEAERLRLYYVAMTRAIDRLIVSGSIDARRKADEKTPIGWVLDRLDCAAELEPRGDAPVELERDGARVLVRRRPHAAAVRAAPSVAPSRSRSRRRGQLALFAPGAAPPLPPLAPVLAPIQALPEPPLHDVRRLSYTALALFERCSYRYYAERVAGMRPADAHGTVAGQRGLAATEIGDAVHRLLELVDLQAPAAPDVEQVRAWYPAVTDEELERIGGFVASYCASELARADRGADGARPERPFAFEHDGVLLHGVSTCSTATARARSSSTTRRTRSRGARPRRSSRPTTGCSGSSTRSRASAPGREEVEVVYQFLERPDAVVSTRVHARATCRRSRRSSRRRSRGSRRASSSRRRASSPARAARRSTSSAPGRARALGEQAAGARAVGCRADGA